jgi:hypothetical protein
MALSYRLAGVAVLAALAIPLATIRAEEPAKATGTISGKVVKADNSPVAGAQVRVMHANAKKKKAEAAEQGADKGGEKGGEKGKRPAPVAEATSASDGTFTVTVPEGEYRVAAGDKAAGLRGWAPVTVTAGQTANVTITVKEGGEGKKKD